MLVPLAGELSVAHLLDVVADIVGDRPISVTLLAAETVHTGRLEEAADRLAAAGIETESTQSTAAPFDAIVDAVPGHDAIVMGAAAPSLSALVFGDAPARVAAASVGPVIVVWGASGEEPEETD